MAEDPWVKEYYTLVDIVRDFDQRLLTVKGWAVTLSLAALGFGFQYQHAGLFLVASMSGVAFWAIEGLMKRYQARYYVRMREIEVATAATAKEHGDLAGPAIDWSWTLAPRYFSGKLTGAPPAPRRYAAGRWYRLAWLAPQVALPHIISVVVGGVLFLMGIGGQLKMPL